MDNFDFENLLTGQLPKMSKTDVDIELAGLYNGKVTNFNLADFELDAESIPVAAGTRPPDFPVNITLLEGTFQNWDLDTTLSSVWIAYPKNETDVVTIANWAATLGYKVRPKGKSHNWSPLAVGKDEDPNQDQLLFVDTTNLQTKSFAILDGMPAATFGAGVTIDDITDFLQKKAGNNGTGPAPGYSFINMTGPGDLTIGGALAIGGHGTSIRPDGIGVGTDWDLGGCLSNLVLSFNAIVTDPNGTSPDEYEVKTFNRSGALAEDAAAFLVHLGRAFITEVTLRVVPNYYLQVTNWWPEAANLFIAPPALDSNPMPADSLQRYVCQYGRVEVIWFPMADKQKPWVKTWEQKDKRIIVQVPGPYNYVFADTLGPVINQIIRNRLKNDPTRTINFQNTCFQTASTALHASNGYKMNGTSRNLLLYVKPTTLLVTSFGYAVQIKRTDIQKTANLWYTNFMRLLNKYKALNKYPVNSAVEMRCTLVDKVSQLNPADTSGTMLPPLLAASAVSNGDSSLDTVFWVDVLTIPGTTHMNEFFGELEDWMDSVWGTTGTNTMRPEWSKGWAYTRDDATSGTGGSGWSNEDVLKNRIPQYYGDNFAKASAILAKYDGKDIYRDAFLKKLMP
jgi:hypothetical protein